jgi:hypothetical protein
VVWAGSHFLQRPADPPTVAAVALCPMDDPSLHLNRSRSGYFSAIKEQCHQRAVQLRISELGNRNARNSACGLPLILPPTAITIY